MNGPTVGLLTIGQSARDDLFPEITRFLRPHIKVIITGALDELSTDQVAQLAPSSGEIPLITRLKDGTSTVVGKEKVFPFMQHKINFLQLSGANFIVLLCTGPFYNLVSKAPILKPGNFFSALVKEISLTDNIGVLVPLKEQIEIIRLRWARQGINAHIDCASPYGDLEDLKEAAERLSSIKDLSLIIMDCLGYSLKMKQLISPFFQAPIILPRSLIAGIINELFQ